MDRQPAGRERTGIIQIISIGIVLAVALWGGLHVLGSTRATWEHQRTERQENAARIRAAAANAESTARTDHQRAFREAQLRAIVAARERYAADVAAGRLRCLNGQVFRRLDNGWENVPGQTCQ